MVPLEQCRLVKYDEYSETMEQSFDGQEVNTLYCVMALYVSFQSRPFSLVVGGVRQFYNFDLFLEVRGKDEQFRIYKPGGNVGVVCVLAYSGIFSAVFCRRGKI